MQEQRQPGRFGREIKALLRIAGPLIVNNLSVAGMQFADAVMAGRLGAEALAAVAVGGSVWFLGFTLALGTLVYALSSRLRAAEFRTLRRIGSPPAFVARLVIGEIVAVVICAAVFAAVTTYAVRAALGDLTAWMR